MKRDYKLFYALLRQHPYADKEELVMQFTDGRTTSLREMTDMEYMQMVGALEEASAPARAELKRWRSSALLRIGRLGINTIDNWDGINAFVSSRKIAGKPFYELTIPELQQLVRKLEAIEKKGGLKSLNPSAEALRALSWAFRPTVAS
ncbi:MAG: hypothetical protein II008_20955 [Oscillospiraceae bacterium]|nr:hypothetical protein [Oscillospiraceae bacterium]